MLAHGLLQSSRRRLERRLPVDLAAGPASLTMGLSARFVGVEALATVAVAIAIQVSLIASFARGTTRISRPRSTWP